MCVCVRARVCVCSCVQNRIGWKQTIHLKLWITWTKWVTTARILTHIAFVATTFHNEACFQQELGSSVDEKAEFCICLQPSQFALKLGANKLDVKSHRWLGDPLELLEADICALSAHRFPTSWQKRPPHVKKNESQRRLYAKSRGEFGLQFADALFFIVNKGNEYLSVSSHLLALLSQAQWR